MGLKPFRSLKQMVVRDRRGTYETEGKRRLVASQHPKGMKSFVIMSQKLKCMINLVSRRSSEIVVTRNVFQVAGEVDEVVVVVVDEVAPQEEEEVNAHCLYACSTTCTIIKYPF